MKVKFFTLGCKVNQYETQALRDFFLSYGMQEVKQGPANLYCVNTCTVTHKADVKSLKYIRKLRREYPKATILVTGCLVEKDKKLIQSQGADIIVPQSKKQEILDLFDKHKLSGTDIWSLKIQSFLHNRAFVKIQDGCDNYCSFCKVRLVRGKSRSRSSREIIQEIQRLIEKGFREIVLVGINLGSWKEKSLNFVSLLSKIHKLKNLGRLRLSSLEPEHLNQDLLKFISRSDKICSHLHFPFQSGSDKILKLMKKRASCTSYLKLIENIRKFMPDCGISCDIIVGFPHEQEEDFAQSLELLKKAKSVRSHIFPYSERAGTASFGWPKVGSKIVAERCKRAQDAAKKASFNFRKTQTNGEHLAVIDSKPLNGKVLGYTENYIRVSISNIESKLLAKYPKQLFPIKIEKITLAQTYGRIINSS